jgi:hypothetical protein
VAPLETVRLVALDNRREVWPKVSEPRFVVTSVTGYGGDGGTGSREATVYQVLDWPFNYELCFEAPTRVAAEKCAAALEAGDDSYPERVYRRRAYQVEYAARFR